MAIYIVVIIQDSMIKYLFWGNHLVPPVQLYIDCDCPVVVVHWSRLLAAPARAAEKIVGAQGNYKKWGPYCVRWGQLRRGQVGSY